MWLVVFKLLSLQVPKIGYPWLPSVDFTVSHIKTHSFLSHPYFTGSRIDINPFPNEQLQLKNHRAKLCPQEIKKRRRVKGQQGGFFKKISKLKKNDIFRFLSILKEIKRKERDKKKKKRTSDRLLPGTDTPTPKWKCSRENEKLLNDLSFNELKIRFACSF